MSQIAPRHVPYNQKGRAASIARAKATASGKRARRQDEQALDAIDDSNALIIDPVEQKKRREEQRKLAEETIETLTHMSSKKRKRFEAFVTRKLKKEQRAELISSIAKTQTQNLSLQSSSSLGSKQFKTQADRLNHANHLEESRRGRAKAIIERVKGKAGARNLSDEDVDIDGDDEENDSDQQEDVEMEEALIRRELIPTAPEPTTTFSRANATTLNTRQPPPVNVSGTLEIIDVPRASTSSLPAAPAPPATVGSGLVAGAQVTVVKRAKKEKGRMRALVEHTKYGKGKGKVVENEEGSEEESDFDSSEESGSGEDEEVSDAESWYGIGEEQHEQDADGAEQDEGDEEEKTLEQWAEGKASSGAADEEAAPSARATHQKGSFTAWADKQILSASGQLDAVEASVQPTSINGVYEPLLPAGSGVKASTLPEGITGPLGAPLPKNELPSMPPQRTTHIPITRTEEMDKQRAELPIVKEEDRIMDAIRGHPVVVICGETGSGKTTQIGQFLWEAGFGDKSSDNPGMVAITQPRRVAALSTSARVRAELCLPSGSTQVAHRIRYSSTSGADTKLVFMTDGVLLRELAADFLLGKYSVVVIDEAHERGVNTDVLIGVLSRVARLREKMWRDGKDEVKPLRLIIMSATLRVADFAENSTLFPTPPPVLRVDARQHPVTLHFARKTHHNYLEQAYKKVARIHARLPQGGVLVFCTGQNEIVSLCKKLEAKFGKAAIETRKHKAEEMKAQSQKRLDAKEERKSEREAREEREQDAIDIKGGRVEMGDDVEVEELELGEDNIDLAADVDDGIYDEDPEGLESDEEEEKFGGMDFEDDTDGESPRWASQPMHILPLYSFLPTEKQMRVFQPPPEGTRLVVVATNVAETAITIPNVKYVIDAGRAKERQFDPANGIQSFEVTWISKASAQQRAGRAGRTGPGHCYRLYSSAVFENFFEAHTKPEILRMPIEGIVLQMKSMNIDSVANFPFPTPPDRHALREAEKTLINLGALEAKEGAKGASSHKITELGRSMSLFPLSPRFSKMIVAGRSNGCLPYVIAIVCALSVGDPFIREANLGDDEDELPDSEERKALSAAEIRHIRDPELRRKEELKVARKAFFESQKIHSALGQGASDVFKMLSVVGAYEYDGAKASFCNSSFVRVKAMEEIHKLRAQISRIVSTSYHGFDVGFDPQLPPPSTTQLKVLRQLLTSAFIDQVAIRKDLADKASPLSYAKTVSTRGVPYRAFGIDEDIFIHPSSTLFHQAPPEFVVFQEVMRTNKVWMKSELFSFEHLVHGSAFTDPPSSRLTAVTKINPAWLPTLGRPMCTFSKPVETASTSLATKADPTMDGSTRKTIVTPRFGPGVGIELKPILMEQRLVKGRWVFV
ncbi:BQ5605_C004g02989 [Microbotryum silenes-dioicae]|uniref:RNA helicase n=1 Tax=Microbotryum silenes-dioicae TaxID=796604 RepID=A0A2X0MCQ7_9BASI|nr:BQ5605_C004g02989 [Microbotryum silenes-dioicae]